MKFIHVYIHRHICAYTCSFIYTHIYIYVYLRMDIYICMHVHGYIYIGMGIYMHGSRYIYVIWHWRWFSLATERLPWRPGGSWGRLQRCRGCWRKAAAITCDGRRRWLANENPGQMKRRWRRVDGRKKWSTKEDGRGEKMGLCIVISGERSTSWE